MKYLLIIAAGLVSQGQRNATYRIEMKISYR